MDTKQWAVFFVALLSFDYATATYFGKDGYYGWSKGCRCNKDLTSRLDGALQKAKRSFLGKYRNGCPLKDANHEEYVLTKGKFQFDKFERQGPYQCSLSNNYVRIYFKIGFFNLLINYYVNFVEDLFSGFFGGIASFLGKIIGAVTNFLFRIVIPDVYCTVVLIQNFGGGGFKVEGLYLDEIKQISFKNKGFSKYQSRLGPQFIPTLDHVLRYAFNFNFVSVLTTHVTEVRAEKSWFYYNSEKEYSGSYDSSGGSSGDYYSKKSSGGGYEESGSDESETRYSYGNQNEYSQDDNDDDNDD